MNFSVSPAKISTTSWPKLDGTAFAVFGLGDTSYEFFCQSGKDFDNKLA
ncbi:hypothetical protein C0U44_20225, partial [Klebsiella pneumoniae]